MTQNEGSKPRQNSLIFICVKKCLTSAAQKSTKKLAAGKTASVIWVIKIIFKFQKRVLPGLRAFAQNERYDYVPPHLLQFNTSQNLMFWLLVEPYDDANNIINFKFLRHSQINYLIKTVHLLHLCVKKKHLKIDAFFWGWTRPTKSHTHTQSIFIHI